ncbi:MAG: anaerobic nitric oxide reductase flavorubredoxin [Candidatus Methanomethylophilaceae archaeon]|nr:anaerobic nitric oxide reductase flavorubredoxin [Candidatus Methanomethylophilaceae archaeon]
MKETIKSNVSWVGYMDWELQKFHGDDFTIINGSSQNAYLVEEDRTVLIDTVWTPHREEFIDNLKKKIGLENIDIIVMNHGEADHSGALPELMRHIPDIPIYCTANAVKSLEGQYGKRGWDLRTVKTGDSVDIGNGKKLIFVEMKMLHWPDSMATYLTGDNILFSNDAFGQHFAVGGLFNDTADRCMLEKEAMKYYANILNPFSSFVSKKIDEIKSMKLPIDIIAPSHGAIWRDDPMQIVEKYAEWAAAYQEDQLTIVYDTMWEGTATIAHEIAEAVAKISPETAVKVFNCSKADKSEIMAEVFRSKAIAVGSPTVGGDVLTSVSGTVRFMKSLKFKGKKAAAFGCYGWSGEGVAILKKELADAGFQVIDESIRSMWKPDEEDLASAEPLARALLE